MQNLCSAILYNVMIACFENQNLNEILAFVEWNVLQPFEVAVIFSFFPDLCCSGIAQTGSFQLPKKVVYFDQHLGAQKADICLVQVLSYL